MFDYIDVDRRLLPGDPPGGQWQVEMQTKALRRRLDRYELYKEGLVMEWDEERGLQISVPVKFTGDMRLIAEGYRVTVDLVDGVPGEFRLHDEAAKMASRG